MKFGNPLVKFKLNDHDLLIIKNAITEDNLEESEASNQDLRSCKIKWIENSNLRLIVNKKNYDQIKELFEDFTNDLVESQNKKKIESLEKKLINNMEEKAFTELLKLKSQINRD